MKTTIDTPILSIYQMASKLRRCSSIGTNWHQMAAIRLSEMGYHERHRKRHGGRCDYRTPEMARAEAKHSPDMHRTQWAKVARAQQASLNRCESKKNCRCCNLICIMLYTCHVVLPEYTGVACCVLQLRQAQKGHSEPM